jgi:hypothetical protein
MKYKKDDIAYTMFNNAIRQVKIKSGNSVNGWSRYECELASESNWKPEMPRHEELLFSSVDELLESLKNKTINF